jgi:hypothetical protein
VKRHSGNFKKQGTRGIAIVVVLVMLVVVAGLLSVSSLLALGNRKTTADTVIAAQAQYIAEAAVEVALKRVYWDPYNAWQASADAAQFTSKGDPVQFDNCAFKKWLTGYGKDATSAQLIANNAADCPYTLFTAVVSSSGNPLPGLLNNTRVTILDSDTGSVAIANSKYVINVERRDNPNGEIDLLMDVTGQVVDSSNKVLSERRLSRTLKISGEPYEGDKFAMLATAANCSFCHLQVDTMQRAFSTSGTFDRARVGFTDANPSALLDFSEKSKPDVVIYGGMYVRAGLDKLDRGRTHSAGDWARYAAQSNGLVKAGKNSDLVPAGKFFSGTTGPSGDFQFNNSAETATNSFAWDASAAYTGAGNNGGANRANGAFYYNYPSEAEVKGIAGLDRTGNVISAAQIETNKTLYKGKWPDGSLPDSFPAVIAGGEDGISDAEWGQFVLGNVGGKILNSGTQTATDGEPRIYGVRRPSSTSIETTGVGAIPWTYDPIAANGITDTGTLFTETDMVANPTTYRKWWLTQALASPNNRDFLPTFPTTNSINQFNITATNGTYDNNFWVNYSNANTLSLAFCNKFGATNVVATGSPQTFNNLQRCARGGYDGFTNFVAQANNRLTQVQLPVGQNVWFPQTSNAALADLRAGTKSGKSGYFDGNLIIDAGTLSSGRPLFIEGTIMINGDLVIRGKIRGAGRIVARGNIYVVGDLVYACQDDGTICTKAQYAAAGSNLGKLALLAGGNIIVGDYDAPDSRLPDGEATAGGVTVVPGDFNRASDLLNDQTGRNAVPSADRTWDYFNVPGATGRPWRSGTNGTAGAQVDIYATLDTTTGQLSSVNPNTDVTGFNGRAGFMTRLTNIINAAGDAQKFLYKVSPFGYMLDGGSTPEEYENGNDSNFRNGTNTAGVFTAGKTINPIYPSNGPIRIGDVRAVTAGQPLLGQVASGVGVACRTTSNANMPVRRFIFSPTTSGSSATPNNNVPLAPLQFGFWCPPSTLAVGSYIRRNGGTGVTGAATNPSGTNAAWMRVSDGDEALDGNRGVTTGWLGGVLTDQSGNAVLGDLSQTRLLKLMWLSGMENGRAAGPLRTNGVFYSANSIVNLLRAGNDGRANRTGQSLMQSRWIHVGSVIASELAFLASASAGSDTSGKNFTVNRNTIMDFEPATGTPDNDSSGSWGAGLSILYDNRLQGLLQITTGAGVKIRRTGVYAQVGIAR